MLRAGHVRARRRRCGLGPAPVMWRWRSTGSLATEHLGFRGGRRRRRCRHHEGAVSALDRARGRGQGRHPAVRGARRAARGDAQRLAAARRRGLDAERAPGRAVGQDGQAARLSCARDLGRRSAPGRDADGRDDHRRQHRPGGADLRRRPLRRGGWTCSRSPTSSSRRWISRSCLVLLAATKTRPVFWHFTPWLKVLWYVLAVASVVVFVYGVLRPIAKYRRGKGGPWPPVPWRELPGRLWTGAGLLFSHRTIGRRDHGAGWAHRRSSTASWCCSPGP